MSGSLRFVNRRAYVGVLIESELDFNLRLVLYSNDQSYILYLVHKVDFYQIINDKTQIKYISVFIFLRLLPIC